MGNSKEIVFKLVLFFCSSQHQYAQPTRNEFFKDKGWSFKIQSSYIFHMDDKEHNVFDSNYEVGGYTHITGVGLEINYYLSPHLGVGIGAGYEEINKPNFHYYPIYLNIIVPILDEMNSLYVKANFGGHYGISRPGFLFRAGLGYRFIVYEKLLSNIEITYMFQNMYKYIDHVDQINNYHNIEGVGVSLGIEFN